MKALFEQIGIDDQSNVDEETIDFIYDFVDKHGGVEALRKDLAGDVLSCILLFTIKYDIVLHTR